MLRPAPAPTPSLIPAPSPVPLMLAAGSELLGVRLRKDRSLRRVRPGVYADSATYDRLAPWNRYLARVHAYALVNPDAVFALESAGALRGLPVFGEPRHIHVFDSDRTTSDRFGDVVVHTSADGRSIDALERLAATSLADTVVDLSRALPPAFALAVTDAALRASGGTLQVAQLADLAAGQRNPRGRRRLEWLCTRADARAESSGESVSRAVIEWCGFEEPALQHEFFFEGVNDRVDFFWPSIRVAGESDGYGKYPDDPAAARRALIEEKRREDRLRRYLRGMGRWDWADTMRVTPLRRALLTAGVRIVRPAQPALLATLARNPRSLAR